MTSPITHEKIIEVLREALKPFAEADDAKPSIRTEASMADRYSFRLFQDGIMVAAGSGDDKDRVAAEAMHYATMYAQDGACTLQTKGFSIGEPAPPPDTGRGQG